MTKAADETSKVSEATSKKYLSFDEFMEPDKTEFDEVVIGRGVFRIGSVTGEEWTEWAEMRETAEGRKRSAGWLIAKSQVDADGRRIGDTTRAAEIIRKNIRTSETILRAIFKLNGIKPNATAEAIAKNA